MKTPLKLIVLVGGLALAASLPSYAQSDTSAPSPKGERGPGGPGRRGPEMMFEQLGLSADQKAKLEPILKSQREQMQALRQDQSLSDDDRRAKARAVREGFAPQINAILTPDQQKKFAEMRARGPQGGPPPGEGRRRGRGGQGSEGGEGGEPPPPPQ